MKKYSVYVLSIIVITASVCFIYLLPLPEELRNNFSFPAIFGLFSLLTQGWRDQVEHERKLSLQQKQHDFDLAVASHMTNVVFDKQVDFCEQYSQKLQAIVFELFHNGPSSAATEYEKELREIRMRFSPWISNELTEKLLRYEEALGELGYETSFIEMIPESPHRAESFEIIYDTFRKFIPNLAESMPDAPEAIGEILNKLQEILGIFDLETLRRSAIRIAKARIEEDS